MPEVAWRHPLHDVPYTIKAESWRVDQVRRRLEEARLIAAEPDLGWLSSRQYQLSEFYRLLALFYQGRELILDKAGYEYKGEGWS